MSSTSEGRRPSTRGAWVATVLLVAGLTASACATTGALNLARRAERAEDFDLAVAEYEKAVRAKPTDRELRLVLERARAKASERHFITARRYAGAGKLEEALVEYQLASELNPSSSEIDEELRTTRSKLRARLAVSREGRTQLETLVEQASTAPPPGLDLPTDVKLPDSLVFRDAGSRDVFTAIARFSGVNVVFDPTFRDTPLTVDLRNTTLEDALTSLTTSTHTFFRVTAPKTVTIVPDTPAKRREYEEEVIRTFYLSNADLKETLDLLRIVVDNRRLSPITATNAITIKDTPERISAAAKVISAIDKARAEVVIDVELLEVDRTRLREYGLQIASPGSSGVSGSANANRDGLTLRDLRSLKQSDIYLANLPALYYRLLKSDTATRALANPQLRTSEGIAAQAKFGERVPVPQTTFAPIATGGVNQQPITSFAYENIGVNIDITPRTHHNDDVTLALKVEVSSLSGTGFGGLPTFGNRAISTTIRLKDGETNLLAGLIRDDERTVLSGLPGLSDLPLVGRLFANNRKEVQETDIVLMITPRIVRVLDLTAADLRPFKVGRGDGSTIVDLNFDRPPAPAPQQPPPATPATPPTVPPRPPPPPPGRPPGGR
ncbi:MAG: secretin N-terminal domain-containing protein [Vicinamibacterales bacterium]